MNSTIYIFGDLGNGYQQYPDDYTKEIFKNFVANKNSQSQISIHRNGSLMYYGYLHKLENPSFFVGYSIVLNGVMFNQIESLSKLFQNTITFLVSSGNIVTLNHQGQMVPQNGLHRIGEKERELIAKHIQSGMQGWEDKVQFLPPVYYQIEADEKKHFSSKESQDEIINASYRYSYTHIYYGEESDSNELIGFQSTLKELNREKNDLKAENAKLIREKKQYSLIAIVAAIAIVFLLGLIFIGNSLIDSNNKLNYLTKQITQKKEEIQNLQYNNNQLSSELAEKKFKYRVLSEKFSKWKKAVGSSFPIVIKEMSIANVYQDGTIQTDFGDKLFSFNTMYLKPRIRYFGVKDGADVTLDVKLYTPPFGELSQNDFSPDSCSWNRIVTVEEGDNIEDLANLGWGASQKGRWDKGEYLLEIWYKNVCLFSKEFAIY